MVKKRVGEIFFFPLSEIATGFLLLRKRERERENQQQQQQLERVCVYVCVRERIIPVAFSNRIGSWHAFGLDSLREERGLASLSLSSLG